MDPILFLQANTTTMEPQETKHAPAITEMGVMDPLKELEEVAGRNETSDSQRDNPNQNESVRSRAVLISATVTIYGDTKASIYLLIDPLSGSVVCPQQTVLPRVVRSSSVCTEISRDTDSIADSTEVSNPLLISNSVSLSDIPEAFQGPPIASRAPSDLSSTSSTLAVPDFPPTEGHAPFKPLNPYNFFFQDERDRILHGLADESESVDYSGERLGKILTTHWGRDRSKKRPHRKSHGKIGFKKLSSLISTKWHTIPEEGKHFYRRIAEIDTERYKAQLKETERNGYTE